MTPNGDDWTATIPVSRGVDSGTYPIQVTLTDRAGNLANWGGEELVALGAPSSIDIMSTPDQTGPRLRAFTFTPRAVDTRRAAKTITVVARVSDAEAGVRSISVRAVAPPRSATPPRNAGQPRASLSRVPGTTSAYRGRMTMPRWVLSGTWHMRKVRMVDNVGNASEVSYDQLGRRGFPRNVAVLSRRDLHRPSLSSFTRGPAVLDVRTSDGSVGVRVRAKDTGSGVREVRVILARRTGSGVETWLRPVSGTSANGVWRGQLQFRHCDAVPGTWSQAYVVVLDRAGGYRDYGEQALTRRGFPSTVTVLAEDHIAPSLSLSLSEAGQRITLAFDEDVNGIEGATALVREYGDPEGDPPLPGLWTCMDSGGTTTSCTDGTVRKAIFDAAGELTSPGRYGMELNPEHQLGLTDLAGNPVASQVYGFHLGTE